MSCLIYHCRASSSLYRSSQIRICRILWSRKWRRWGWRCHRHIPQIWWATCTTHWVREECTTFPFTGKGTGESVSVCVYMCIAVCLCVSFVIMTSFKTHFLLYGFWLNCGGKMFSLHHVIKIVGFIKVSLVVKLL